MCVPVHDLLRLLVVYEGVAALLPALLVPLLPDPGWWRMEGAGLQGLPQQLREMGPQEEKA